jgi:hypothetical protein
MSGTEPTQRSITGRERRLKVRTLPLDYYPADVCNRRNLAIDAPVGEGPKIPH